MIRYALRCGRGHDFESWFASAGAFDRLAAAGALSCAICGGDGVTKALMAPSVPKKGEAPAPAPATAPPPEAAAEPAPVPGPPAPPTPALAAPGHPMAAAIRALRAHVEANAENVGRAFPRIARDIHDGVEEARPVYGEATPEEARELAEEGVPVLPLPWPRRHDS